MIKQEVYMPIIRFNNFLKVAEHPQAKLLGWELLSSLFNHRLNELEVSMLEKGVDEIGLGNLLSLNSETEKQRLLICAVLSDVSPQSIRDLYDLAKQDNNISKKKVAETFLLSGDINVINACFSELNEAEVRSLALTNSKFYLKELVIRGLLSSMAFLLNYQFSNGHSIKELVTTAYHQDFYSKACSNGHLNIIEHLEAIEGFDKKAAAEADDYDA